MTADLDDRPIPRVAPLDEIAETATWPTSRPRRRSWRARRRRAR